MTDMSSLPYLWNLLHNIDRETRGLRDNEFRLGICPMNRNGQPAFQQLQPYPGFSPNLMQRRAPGNNTASYVGGNPFVNTCAAHGGHQIGVPGRTVGMHGGNPGGNPVGMHGGNTVVIHGGNPVGNPIGNVVNVPGDYSDVFTDGNPYGLVPALGEGNQYLNVDSYAVRNDARNAGGSSVGKLPNSNKDGYQICMDVQQFKPNELNVKIFNNHIIIEGKHKQREDAHGIVARHFIHRYALPNGFDAYKVSATLSSDGILAVAIPKPLANEEKCKERIISIQQTGPSYLNLKVNQEVVQEMDESVPADSAPAEVAEPTNEE